MTSDYRRARRAGIVLSLVIPLLLGFLGLWAGKDGGWDLQNYHWYNPYALVNDRLGFDLAVAHQATYFNPLLDLPLFCAARALPAQLVGFLLAAVQGLNFTLLFWTGWTLFRPLAAGRRLMICLITALAGMLGAGALMEIAAVTYDNVTSLGVLAALWLITARLKVLLAGKPMAAGAWVLLAGILAGAMAGLKLTTAVYALGFCGGLLFVPTSGKRRLGLAFTFGIGVLLGMALFGGFWMYKLWEFARNPFFPYFNDIFKSPLLREASYKDVRFVPTDPLTSLFFPFFFSFDSFRVAEWPFQDVRILCAFIGLPLGVLWARFRGSSPADWMDETVGRFLAVAGALSYCVWLWMFCIYRYLLPLEMIAPLLLAVAMGWMGLTVRSRMLVLFVVLGLSQALVRMSWADRLPWGNRYIEVTAPTIEHPDNAMILMAGFAPMAYVIPAFPPAIPFLRIEGWLATPDDDRTGIAVLMRQRVTAHQGPLYVLFHPDEEKRARENLPFYSLKMKESGCASVASNIGPALFLCEIERPGAWQSTD